MAWDEAALAYIRQTLGQVGAVFSDEELETFFEQAAADLGRESTSGAIYYAVRAVALNASLLADYQAGQTSENRSQVARQMRNMMNDWKKAVEEESAGTKKQLRLAGFAPLNKPEKDAP